MHAHAELLFEMPLTLGESVHWHAARQCLYWLDLYEPKLCRHAAGMTAPEVRTLPLTAPIGSMAATTDPDIAVISHSGGLSWLNLNTLTLTPFCHPEAGRDGVISNDIKCDRWGRLWVATSHAREKDPRGALWCVTSDGTATLGDVGFPIGNGPAFSPGGHTLYLNDSTNRQTLAYDISPDDPHPRNRRVLTTYAESEGLPDGLTVDADGNIWTAQWGGGGVIKLAPDGTRAGFVEVAAPHVTSVCLHDGCLDISTARDGLSVAQLAAFPLSGSVFRAKVTAKPVPEPLMLHGASAERGPRR